MAQVFKQNSAETAKTCTLSLPSERLEPVVETNNGDERCARIDYMLETLQRESAALKAMTARTIPIVQTRTPADLRKCRAEEPRH
jgi:hypothetical protein